MITLESKEIKAFPYSLGTKLFLSTPNSSAVAEGNTVKTNNRVTKNHKTMYMNLN